MTNDNIPLEELLASQGDDLPESGTTEPELPLVTQEQLKLYESSDVPVTDAMPYTQAMEEGSAVRDERTATAKQEAVLAVVADPSINEDDTIAISRSIKEAPGLTALQQFSQEVAASDTGDSGSNEINMTLAERNKVDVFESLKEHADRAISINAPKSALDAVGQAYGAALTPFQPHRAKLVAEAIGVDTNWINSMHPGKLPERMRSHISKLNKDEQLEAIDKMFKVVTENSGWFTATNEGNATSTATFITSLFSGYDQFKRERDSLTMEGRLNVFGVVSGIGVKAASTGVKVAVKTGKDIINKNAPISVITEANPRSGQNAAEAAIADENIAKVYGTDAMSVVNQTNMPKSSIEEVTRMPQNILPDADKMANELRILQMEDADLVGQGALGNTIDRAAGRVADINERVAARKVKLDSDASASIIPVPHAAKTMVEGSADTGTVKIHQWLGDSKDTGFLSYEGATNAAQEIADLPFTSWKVVARENGKWKDATISDEYGEFFIVTEYQTGVRIADRIKSPVVRGGGMIAQALLDTASTLSKEVARSAAGVPLKQSRASDALNRLIKPMSGLSTRKQHKVADQLQIDSDAEVVSRSDDELMSLFSNDIAQVNAYKSVQRLWDVDFKLKDLNAKDRLIQDGFTQSIQVAGRQRLAYVKQVEPGTLPENTLVLDQATGKMIRLPESHNPNRLYTANVAIDVGDEAATHIYLKSVKELKNLPKTVLDNKAGYSRRIADAEYKVVVSKSKRLNGIKTTYQETIALAPSARTAQAWILKNNKKATAVRMTNVDKGQQIGLDNNTDNVLESALHLRGKEIPSVIEGQRAIVDVMGTVDRQVSDISRAVGQTKWADFMTDTFWANYSTLFKSRADVDMLNFTSSARKNLTPDEEVLLREANAHMYKMKLALGTSRGQVLDAVEAQGQRAAVWLIDTLPQHTRAQRRTVADMTNKALKHTAAFVIENGTKVPRKSLSVLSNLIYTTAIIMNPLRQAPLQASMMPIFVGLRHGDKYMATGKATQDISNMLQLFIRKGTSDATKLDMNKESHRMYMDLQESGLIQDVQDHVVLSNTMFGNTKALQRGMFGDVGEVAKRVTRSAEHTMRVTGFQAGEVSSRATAWLFVRNRHLKDTGKTWRELSKADNREIAAEASEILGNMNSFNRSFYNKGLFQTMTQFTTHTNKMMQKMMTEYFLKGGNALSKRERANMTGASILAYGFNGFGGVVKAANREAVRYAEERTGGEVPQDIIYASEQGLVGTMLATAAGYVTDTTTRSDVSASIAPFSGITNTFGDGGTPFHDLADMVYKATMSGQSISVDDYSPGINMGVRTYQAIQDMVRLTGGVKTMNSPSEWTRLHQITASVVPGLKPTWQLKWALDNGQIVSSKGKPTISATDGEIYLKVLFGINSYDSETAWSAIRKYSTLSEYIEPPTRSSLDELGDDVSDMIAALYEGNVSKDKILTDSEILEQSVGILNGVHNLDIDSKDKQYVLKRILEKSRTWGDRQAESIIDRMIKVMETPGLQEEFGSTLLERAMSKMNKDGENYDAVQNYIAYVYGKDFTEGND